MKVMMGMMVMVIMDDDYGNDGDGGNDNGDGQVTLIVNIEFLN